mmetsp:Transcript_38348/g.90952  ORF Transcript_38348/g.90952 Transcript_38348/m.90952 type:complete len:257 (+) Transcript_38348:149-919(+)
MFPPGSNSSCESGNSPGLSEMKQRFAKAQQLGNSQRLTKLSRMCSRAVRHAEQFAGLSAEVSRMHDAQGQEEQAVASGLQREEEAFQETAAATEAGLRELDSRISQQLEELRRMRCGGLQSVWELLEEQTGALDRDLRRRRDSLERGTREEVDKAAALLEDLEKTLKAEAAATDSAYCSRLSALRGEVASIQEAIRSEQQLRQELEHVLVARIEDIWAQLQRNLQTEAAEREKMHQALEQLLEDTLGRLQQDSASG